VSARKVRLLLAAGALLAATAAPAQTVDEIVARHVAARGGREALAKVRTLRMTGRALAGPGRQAIVRREIARPGRIRTEFVFQGTTGVYVWNGSAGWRVSPLDGSLEAQPLTDEAAALSAEQADFEGPLVDWKAKGHQVELVGKDALAGGDAHKLKVTLKSGVVRHVWVDAKTGLVAKTGSTRKVKGHAVELEVLYDDYRETGGLTFARSLDIGAKERPQRLRIVVESVEINPALDDSRFSLPR
jgi:outer membrane lipoprotein-sorting protein